MTRTRRTPVPAWRSTPQQALVRKSLAASPGFVSAQVLHRRMVTEGGAVGLSTVYRALAALTGAGLADIVRDDSGERLYRHRPEAHHQHYLVCRRCGRSLAVDSEQVEAWAARIAEESGFSDVHHTVELAGVCAGCTTVD
ncbi:Fur family ferric uptake transcriptional regulator [Streptomyces sp. 1114.5]|uniref:Fur family transcriptional regulator n=1 Tax=Streptomyces sp. 1114.5 TaxID=1938830 RepID=UPI000EB5045E|nr:Fur family transcriptional regulator [Streptomyces sp. 1114.5]RKT19459.1 Fur family ferric uptake transcriptional regulator [Streptomyces sp. 1114.5]